MQRKRKDHDTIIDGDAVGVLLSNHPARVWVYRDDYARIVTEHGQRAWTWIARDRYALLMQACRKPVMIARLVLLSDGTGLVRYADGDRMNLRRGNVRIDAPKPRREVKQSRPHKVAATKNRVSAPPSPPTFTPSPRPYRAPQGRIMAVATMRRL